MRKYEKYKNSGIKWLGMVPEHWKIRRVKDLANTSSGTTPNTRNNYYYEHGDNLWIRTTDLNEGELLFSEFKITSQAIQECNLTFLPINSILIAMYGGFGTIGKNAILKTPATINQSVCAILPSKTLNPYYLLFFLKFFRDKWKLFADGTRKDPNIKQDYIKNLSVFLPTLSEQNTIVNYLDSKTQLIDKKIELLSKKIDTYKELRKSLIKKVVCRGLDEDIKLKDSGIDWIGKIPEHWEVKRFKAFANTLKGKNLEYHDLCFEKSLPNLSLEYLRNNSSSIIDYCYSPDKALIANEQDLIIIWDGAGVGEILKAKRGYVSSTIAKLQFTKECDTRFFYFFKDSLEYTLKSIPTGMGIPHLNPNILNNYKFPIPPIKEQTRIADYLEQKTLYFEQIIYNIQQQIEKLQELRKTLINDVVTGKIKVTE